MFPPIFCAPGDVTTQNKTGISTKAPRSSRRKCCKSSWTWPVTYTHFTKVFCVPLICSQSLAPPNMLPRSVAGDASRSRRSHGFCFVGCRLFAYAAVTCHAAAVTCWCGWVLYRCLQVEKTRHNGTLSSWSTRNGVSRNRGGGSFLSKTAKGGMKRRRPSSGSAPPRPAPHRIAS